MVKDIFNSKKPSFKSQQASDLDAFKPDTHYTNRGENSKCSVYISKELDDYLQVIEGQIDGHTISLDKGHLDSGGRHTERRKY